MNIISAIKHNVLDPADSNEGFSHHQTQTIEKEVDNLIHELSQPLTTMSLYIRGCIYRLTNGTPDAASILLAMNKAMQELECAQNIAFSMKNYYL